MTAVLFALALALGFKHSYDADHLVAVSGILTRSRRARRTVALSTLWAVGHMGTASIITLVLFTLKDLYLMPLLANLGWIVAAMLVTIGLLAIVWELGAVQRHDHPHAHGKAVHTHDHFHFGPWRDHHRMLGVGFVHGVASNDELLVLLTASLGVTSLQGVLMGVAIFSSGVVMGMILFGLGLTLPMMKWGSKRVRKVVNLGAAIASLGYGLLLFSGMNPINPFSPPMPK